jgi:Arc/MetJ-type ribon-helix-helix transcriptional regulator
MTRARLSATIDPELLQAGRDAVAEGRAENLSAWVNEALQRQRQHDQRMRALDEFIERFEREHGVISDREIEEAARRLRARATPVRTEPEPVKPPRARRRGRR